MIRYFHRAEINYQKIIYSDLMEMNLVAEPH